MIDFPTIKNTINIMIKIRVENNQPQTFSHSNSVESNTVNIQIN